MHAIADPATGRRGAELTQVGPRERIGAVGCQGGARSILLAAGGVCQQEGDEAAWHPVGLAWRRRWGMWGRRRRRGRGRGRFEPDQTHGPCSVAARDLGDDPCGGNGPRLGIHGKCQHGAKGSPGGLRTGFIDPAPGGRGTQLPEVGPCQRSPVWRKAIVRGQHGLETVHAAAR